MNPFFAHGTMMGGRQLAGATLFGHGGFALFAFVALAATVALVLFMARRHKVAGPHCAPAVAQPVAPPAHDTALAIARERLARGEIEPEQYTAIVSALNG